MDIMIYPKVASVIIAASVLTVSARAVVRSKRRPESEDRGAPIACGCAIAVIAAFAYAIGVPVGIAIACSSPSATNLCGLTGFFMFGPIFAAAAAVLAPLVFWMIVRWESSTDLQSSRDD